MSSSYFLKLSENPLRFEPLRKMTNVFYDDKSNEIVTVVYAGDSTQIFVENAFHKKKKVFKVFDRRHIISVKFSPDQAILAVQRSACEVDFVTFINNVQHNEFSTACKGNNSKILGFIWISNIEILYVTNQGLELYQVDKEKKCLKYMKHININIIWFLYYSKKNFVLLCIGSAGVFLQPVFIHEGNFNKIPKFEVHGNQLKKVKPVAVSERDVIITVLYGQLRILIFQHNQQDLFRGTQIAIYTINKMMSVKKTHVLKLNQNGRFALNVVDDLVIVHHQLSKTSSIFDICIPGQEEDMHTIHYPITEDKSIMPSEDIEGELYSTHWVTFQPDIVIDVGMGYFWFLLLNLECFTINVTEKCVLIDFLMLRKSGKKYLIKMLNELIQKRNKGLEEMSTIYNRLNAAYKSILEMEAHNRMGFTTSSITLNSYKPFSNVKVIIDQSEMYTSVLIKVADNTPRTDSSQKNKYIIWVLLEYIRSLTDHLIPVQHCIHELLINTLILDKSFHQLHQILQYHVIADTKPLACLLLSLENIYPPAHQLALDMLHRISSATEEITEVMLSKNQIIQAIRYNDVKRPGSELSFRKYLDVASTSTNPSIFYSVFAEFEKRDSCLAENASQLHKDGLCDSYIKTFQKQFRTKND